MADRAIGERFFAEGAQLHVANRFSEAITQYDKALAILPRYASIHNNKGSALLVLSQQEKNARKSAKGRRAAEESMRQAAQLSPSNLDAYLNLGVLYRAQEAQLPEAIASFSTAVGIAPSSSAAYEKLGACLLAASESAADGSEQQLRHATAAVSAFSSAVALAPSDGVQWERQGDALLAVAAHAQAKPASSAAGKASGVAAGTATTAFAEAARVLTRAVELQPAHAGAYAKLAIAVHGVGLHTDQRLLEPLLHAMRQLQLAAPDASRLVRLASPADPQHSMPCESCVPREEEAAVAADADPPATCRADMLLEACEVDYDGSELPGASGASGAAGGACSVRAILLRATDDATGGMDSSGGGIGESTNGASSAPGSEHGESSASEQHSSSASGRSQLVSAFATPVFVHRLPRRVTSRLHAALLPELLARERQQQSVRHSNRGGWQSTSDLLSGDSSALSPALRKLRTHILEAASAFVRQLHSSTAPAASPATPLSERAATQQLRGARPPPAELRLSVLNAWANLNRAGDLNLFHDHPQAILSGVYFIADGSTGDGASGGWATGGWATGGASSGVARSRGQRHSCGASGGNGSIELVDPRFTLRTHRPPEQFEPSCARLGAATSRSLRPGYLFEYSPPLQIEPTPGTFLLFPAWLMHRVRPHALRHGVRASVSFNVWLADEPAGPSGSPGIAATQRLFDLAAYRSMPAGLS